MSFDVKGTPAYISPEIAQVMLAKLKGESTPNIKASTSIDIFALGLIVWEMFNQMKSFWMCMKVPIQPTCDITFLSVAAGLTDEVTLDALKYTFGDSSKRALISRLQVRTFLSAAQLYCQLF